MPNHVTNQITFETDGDALSVFHNMLPRVQANGEPLGSIDFNSLIPMPDGLGIEQSSYMEKGLKLYQAYKQEVDRSDPIMEFRIKQKWETERLKDPAMWALGEQAYENIQKCGYPTWYEWSIQNWGTKWDAYQCQPLDKNADTMVFLTAWSAVPKIVAALSRRYPDQTVTYRWADEDIGFNVGEAVYQNGECIGQRDLKEGSREAYELAAGILGVDLASYNLYLSEDGSRYEYREQARPAAPKGKDGGQSR